MFFTGASETFPSGNRVVYGAKGEVTGPATGKEVSTHVDEQFPGNKGGDERFLTTLSRTAPSRREGGSWRRCSAARWW